MAWSVVYKICRLICITHHKDGFWDSSVCFFVLWQWWQFAWAHFENSVTNYVESEIIDRTNLMGFWLKPRIFFVAQLVCRKQAESEKNESNKNTTLNVNTPCSCWWPSTELFKQLTDSWLRTCFTVDYVLIVSVFIHTRTNTNIELAHWKRKGKNLPCDDRIP